MRPTELSTFSIYQFKKMEVSGKVTRVVYREIRSFGCASKTSKGGFSEDGVIVPEALISGQGYDGYSIIF